MEMNDAVRSLSALAAASRLSVFRLLVQAGSDGMPAGRISEATGIAPSSLSFHLKELTHAGLARSRQEGRFVIYTANYETMNALLGYLTDNCCEGQPCLPAMPRCVPEAKPRINEQESRRQGKAQ